RSRPPGVRVHRRGEAHRARARRLAACRGARRVSARGIPGTNAIWVEKTVGPSGAPYDIIRVPNTLAVKAGEFRAARAPIDAVDATVASLQTESPDRAAPDVARAIALWQRIGASPNGDEAARQELARLAHDFKGTGKTYGYPLGAVIRGALPPPRP